MQMIGHYYIFNSSIIIWSQHLRVDFYVSFIFRQINGLTESYACIAKGLLIIFYDEINMKIYTIQRNKINIEERLYIFINHQVMESQKLDSLPQQNVLPQRTKFHFIEPREPNILFNSNFDSGNMHRVVRSSYDHYGIWTASDAQGTLNEGYPKSWFYFEVGGFGNRKINFSIYRVHFLYSMCKRPQMYRPVFRVKSENGQMTDWDRLPYAVLDLSMNQDQQLVLKFDFTFSRFIRSVEFAFVYPYSYEQCRNDLLTLKKQFQNDQQLFFQQCELTKSVEGRIIDALVISSHEGKQGCQLAKGLPLGQQKLTRFRNNKPIIFISARVHPIQTPSSYTINGIIQFLVNKKDARAYMLRKYFVFVLVPMLNPDGVARGHCRMDSLNQNLNRYYNTPDPEKQPSCFAVKKLCEHYNKDKRLFMYLDLHAHPAFKGNFTFGNAIYQFIHQVQSQLFPKILSQNCINFQFEQCVFSRKHMKAKDKNEDISKQGCGRVVFYKQFGLIHSYTLECGYHMNTFDNPLQNPINTNLKYLVKYKLNEKGEKIYQINEKILDLDTLQKYVDELSSKGDDKGYDIFSFTSHQLDEGNNQYYKRELPIYNQQTFYNLGRNILISLLDVWGKNTFSRVGELGVLRRQIAEKQSKLDRFRKEQTGIKAKQKKIVQLIQEQLYGEWHRRNVFNMNSTVNNKEKKRNQTQMSKINSLRSQKSQKTQKLVHPQQAKPLVHSETLIDGEMDHLKQLGVIVIGGRQEKIGSVTSQNILKNKYFSRNFKVTRGKQINSAVQNDKERQTQRAPSINKEILGLGIGDDQHGRNSSKGMSINFNRRFKM